MINARVSTISKGRTGGGRDQLLQEAEQNFIDLKDELANSEVAELAVNAHAVLSTVSAKYSNDAIIDIIPEITFILNKFDASLKVNPLLSGIVCDTWS